jgi:hypothetical protein
VIAVRRIEPRRRGRVSGIIRRVVSVGVCEFGLVSRGFVGIRRRRVVVVVMMRRVARMMRRTARMMVRRVVVRVAVIRVVMIVRVLGLRDDGVVRVRREMIVQPEMQVRRDLEAEHPQHHRETRHHAACAVGRRGAAGRHGLAEYSPAARRAGGATRVRREWADGSPGRSPCGSRGVTRAAPR